MKLLPLLLLAASTDARERCCEQTTRTVSGKRCQKWNSKSPHEPNKTMLDYLQRTTGNINHNQCAFADANDSQPFCYTTNRGKRWEHCNCKSCKQPTKPLPTLPTEGSPTPGCSQTASGRKCQKWNEVLPHKPNERMVSQVIELTGSSDHNKCTRADFKDPKAWCYTIDTKKRWEHCSPLCSGPAPPAPPSDSSAGTRFRDIPEQVPQIDPRSKYDRKGNCLKNCKSRSLSAGIEQCGRNQCAKPKPTYASIWSWFMPQANDDCQKTNTCYDIIGGVMSKEYQTPWQVNLIGPAGCGGTLIAPNKILTAAHCIHSKDPKSWKIRAGHLTRTDREAQIRNVVRLYKHPKYNSRNNDNDITVMIVSPPFDITGRVRPVVLPREDLEITEGNLIVSGTGNTENGYTNHVLVTTVPMHPSAQCENNPNLKYWFSENMICGGKKGRDTCQGDSGGPLVGEIDGKFTIVGVTSWGIGCGDQGKPGVYAKVANYIQWINSKN